MYKSSVDTVMQIAEYKADLAKLETKREKARQNAHNTFLKKYNEGINEIEKVLKNITIVKIDYNMLKRLTLQYNEQYFQSLGLEFYYPNNDTLEKWMVNFIRHDLAAYDSILKNHVFNSLESYFRTELKLGILNKISAVYPDLEQTVTNQINRIYLRDLMS